jgi:hypothetical protein
LEKILLSALGALATALLGFWLGQRKFRSDQSFQRRLEWHEQAVKRLVRAANKLREAAHISQDPVLDKEKDEAWDQADRALDALRGLDMEAELYASDAAYNAIVDAIRHSEEQLQAGLDVLRLVPDRPDPTPEAIRVSINALELSARVMQHAASRLATDVRKTLGLGPVSRRFRLYDDEVTQLLPAAEAVTFMQRVQALRQLIATGRKRGRLVITREDEERRSSSDPL